MADIVILSTADWDHPLWTNKQHTALALAEFGHRVLYVESLGLRAPRAGHRDLNRIIRRLLQMFQFPSSGSKGVGVVASGVARWSYRMALALNRQLLRIGLAWMTRWLDFKHWIFGPTTLLVPSISTFRIIIAAFITVLTASRISRGCLRASGCLGAAFESCCSGCFYDIA